MIVSSYDSNEVNNKVMDTVVKSPGEVSAGEVSAGEVSAGEVNASDANASEANASEVNSSDANASEANACEKNIGEVKISVRGLVEFVLRNGDIDNRHQGVPDSAMQEGSRIHRMIQKRMGSEYQAEVSLRHVIEGSKYRLVIEGRADGIITVADQVTIDEIKGTYRNLMKFREPSLLHLAQAKCYAYIYSLQKGLDNIEVRITYCHIPTEELRYFYRDYTFGELSQWFEALVEEYQKWSDYEWEWKDTRQKSIDGLTFPFDYREGQKELVTNVYSTIYHKKKLFLEAPTGVGKTISTIYPAICAMGKSMGDRIFYLTAKTITRTVADETIELLRRQGLHLKSVILTAKEKICFMDEVECNPDYCPYAKGHYDRINGAIYDLLTSRESFSRETIEEYAKRYQVCPFEMCLDMSLFADAIICDYNYLFDPHVYLKRFFGEGNGGEYLFLIDEAHNLLERGREMYSAVLIKEDFLEIKRELKLISVSQKSKKLRKSTVPGQMTLGLTGEVTVASYRRDHWEIDEGADTESEKAESEIEESEKSGSKKDYSSRSAIDKIIYHLEKCNKELLARKRECDGAMVVHDIDSFVQPLMRLQSAMDDYLSDQEEDPLPIQDRFLDFYFQVSHFLEIYELMDENYVIYEQLCDDDTFLLKLFCVNPSVNLKRCMDKGRSSILFSATFLPIQYYKKLLGGDPEDYEVYAKSIFDPEKKGLFLAEDVTSKYSRRSEEEYVNIARYINEIVSRRHGNYLVFFPSYTFMRRVYEKYLEFFAGSDKECIMQDVSMSEEDREDFLSRFRGNENLDLSMEIAMEIEEDDRILIGFCVLGGIFGEGIDLKKDSLIGAIIVGTGIPQVCFERELLKSYFDDNGENGFDYAYRYPGMNKVLQAAGRVIRTEEDVGIIALLDERFLQMSYRRMFPREWEDYEIVRADTVAGRVERFWNSWL